MDSPTDEVKHVTHLAHPLQTSNQPIPVGVLGFGGLGQAAARVLASKQQMKLVAAADQKGLALNPKGLDLQRAISHYRRLG